MTSAPTFRATLAAALTLAAGPAAAQSVDYGVLAEIFAQPVTASATGKPQLASDVPAALTILGPEDIRRFGARTLPDVLAQVMGLDVVTLGVAAQDVGLRGLTTVQNPRVLVLVNGRQVYLEHVGTPKWAGIPVQLSEIRQIEIVRGPQSALFGFNAVSGVINIVTYNPLLDDRDAAEVTVGTAGRREASVVATLKPLEKLGVRVSAGGGSVNEYGRRDLNVAGREGTEQAERATASIDALAQVAPDVQVGAEFTFSDWKNIEAESSLELQYGTYETLSGRLYAKADTPVGLVDANVYVNRLDFDLTSAGVLPRLASVNTLTVAQLQTLKRLAPELSIRLGGEYRSSELDVPGVSGAEVSYQVWAASGMLDWTPLPDLSVVLAGRQDWMEFERTGPERPPFRNADYDRTVSPFSFNASLVWRAGELDTLRATVGRGSQSLSFAELGLASKIDIPEVGSDIAVSGNPFLDPSEMTQVELGWSRRLPWINGGFVANAYLQDFDDLTVFFDQSVLPVQGVPTVTFGNLGRQRVWGVETALNGSAGPFRGSLSYTWADGNLDVDIRVPVEGLGSLSGERIDLGELSRPHTLKAAVGWSLGDWDLDLLGIWQSAQGGEPDVEFDNEDRGPVFTTQAALSWTPAPGYRITLAGSNLQEKRTSLQTNPPVDRRLWLTAHVSF